MPWDMIVALVRGSGRSARPPRDDSMAILKRRYARGELGRDEYVRMRRDLAA